MAVRSKNLPVPVVWIDHVGHDVGRLSKYHNIFCNTKVDVLVRWFTGDLFQPYLRLSPKLEETIEDLKQSAFPLRKLDPFDPSDLGWTTLGKVHKILSEVTAILAQDAFVERRCSSVDVLHSYDKMWYINSSNEKFSHSILATGSEPKRFPKLPPDKFLDPEIAMDLQALKKIVDQLKHPRIAVIGNSHSAVLVVKNLHDLGIRGQIFSRRNVRFAEWIPPGEYLYSTTGIKGVAADFARENASLFEKYEDSSNLNPEEYDFIIPAIGYERSQLPQIFLNDIQRFETERDSVTSEILPNLYALGIPWPDYWEVPQSGKAAPPGFGGPPDLREGMFGQDYVGFNGMILRAENISEQIASEHLN